MAGSRRHARGSPRGNAAAELAVDPTGNCPECGAPQEDGRTCQDRFHQMLAWEFADPENFAVHHLTVLGYHLQHPSMYSPEGLAEARKLLVEFLDHGVRPDEVRRQNRAKVDSSRQNRAKVDSSRRSWKIRGTPGVHGSYDPPIAWTLTTADVITGGSDRYCERVEAWARSILDVLRAGDRPAGA